MYIATSTKYTKIIFVCMADRYPTKKLLGTYGKVQKH